MTLTQHVSLAILARGVHLTLLACTARVVTQVGASACLSLLDYRYALTTISGQSHSRWGCANACYAPSSSDEMVWNLLQTRSDELRDSSEKADVEFVETVKMLSVVKAAQDIAKLQAKQQA